MDAVGIAIIICVVVGLVIAAVVGVIAFMAGSSHRKKSAEATIGSAEEEAKKIIEEGNSGRIGWGTLRDVVFPGRRCKSGEQKTGS